jgi:hypothetical protein
MLTAWVMANDNAISRLSSEGLDADIDLLTFLSSSPDSAPCLPPQRWSMRDDSDRRGSVNRLPQSRVLLCEAWCVEEGEQKTRRCKGQWKGKDTPRRAGHMAAPSATLRRRVVFACVLSCASRSPALHCPLSASSTLVFTPPISSVGPHHTSTPLYSSTHQGHPHLRHDKQPLPRCQSWNTMAARWS